MLISIGPAKREWNDGVLGLWEYSRL